MNAKQRPSGELFGLTRDTLGRIQSVFSRHKSVERVVVFGSRAMGTYKDGSDIDLALFGASITLREILRIETEIDDLLLPYKVDLVNFATVENPDLRRDILDQGKTLSC